MKKIFLPLLMAAMGCVAPQLSARDHVVMVNRVYGETDTMTVNYGLLRPSFCIEVQDVIGTPTGLTAALDDNNLATLTWDADEDEVTYNIYKGIPEGDFEQVATGVTGITWADTTPVKGTLRYSISAVQNGRESDRCSAVYVKAPYIDENTEWKVMGADLAPNGVGVYTLGVAFSGSWVSRVIYAENPNNPKEVTYEIQFAADETLEDYTGYDGWFTHLQMTTADGGQSLTIPGQVCTWGHYQEAGDITIYGAKEALSTADTSGWVDAATGSVALNLFYYVPSASGGWGPDYEYFNVGTQTSQAPALRSAPVRGMAPRDISRIMERRKAKCDMELPDQFKKAISSF